MSRTLIIKPSNDTASSYGAPLFVVSESRCARSAQFVGERTGFARLSVMVYPPPHRVCISLEPRSEASHPHRRILFRLHNTLFTTPLPLWHVS
ncbi:hypothetical protein F2Q68_00039626 [Brassica cretica]|uniref:Uncharacterized protein n=1 Tax=Brassica cretica TaxID=69181 RepID=A0A8S9MH63_BRACR|nr:hypothetical protein F2Q68_00039626 [Brassica cretica]